MPTSCQVASLLDHPSTWRGSPGRTANATEQEECPWLEVLPSTHETSTWFERRPSIVPRLQLDMEVAGDGCNREGVSISMIVVSMSIGPLRRPAAPAALRAVVLSPRSGAFPRSRSPRESNSNDDVSRSKARLRESGSASDRSRALPSAALVLPLTEMTCLVLGAPPLSVVAVP